MSPRAALRDEKSSFQALKEVMDSASKPRTISFTIQNHTTEFLFTLVLAEGYQKQGVTPPEYETDTGLTVVGQNVQPGTAQTGVIQPNINVLVTDAKCSFHWQRLVEPHDEGDFNCTPDLIAPPDMYFQTPTWEITQKGPRGKSTLLIRTIIAPLPGRGGSSGVGNG